MRFFLCIAFCLVNTGATASQAFEARSVSAAGLSELEAKRYERILRAPGVKRARLFTIHEESLVHGAWVEIPFFGGIREGFRVTKDGREAVWKGRGRDNFDRFVIRKVGGKYSGHILLKGRQYVLAPIKARYLILYEIENEFECGTQDVREAQR
jgi:hypothetical protein